MDDFEEQVVNQATGAFISANTGAEASIVEPAKTPEPLDSPESAKAPEPPEPAKAPEPPESPEPAKRTRSTKQRSVDAARAEKLKELKARYETEFANIQGRKPKPKAYNAAAIISATDPEAKITQILARDRAAYAAKQGKKTRRHPVINANASRRNAPSIIAFTRSEVRRIREEARRTLMELKAKSEAELRAIGSNISVLHPLFHTRRKPGPKSRDGKNLD